MCSEVCGDTKRRLLISYGTVESWENLTTKIPAADSGGCTRQREPFQPSTRIVFKYFPREHEFNYLVPVSAQATETSSGFINSTLFFPTEATVNDQIKPRFNFAPIMRDTDPCQGNRLHYSTSCTDVTLPRSNCVPEFNWVLTWVSNAI